MARYRCRPGRTSQCAGILPQPLDAGVLHGDVRVEALGDGTGDEGGALLLEQLDQPLLLRHHRIDSRRLPVQEGGDGALLGERGNAKEAPAYLLWANAWHLRAVGQRIEPAN